ncbi:MAG TPA: riboflavin synthase [Bryobacteraceae bacterium]|jgi:riboflavin synthase|nr:riboflavin synthase [Bryobacteraceae bacterium]
MFTGIIEEVGSIADFHPLATGARIRISCAKVLEGTSPGASIAVNGACLTAIEVSESSWTAEISPETLRRTNLGDLKSGALVNLERPLRADSRLDGHFVLGHVDATTEIASLEQIGGGNWWLRIRIPPDLDRYIVSKGSVAVDGISLTIAELDEGIAGFTILPYTYEHTALHGRSKGSRVNLEVDILAKHIEKLLPRS